MAEFGVSRNPMGALALVVMLLFLALIAYATATSTKLGGSLYLLSLIHI